MKNRGALALVGALSGCVSTSESASSSDERSAPPLPWERTPFPSVVHPEGDPPSEERVELGRLLFYDPILSRDQATACATCHSEIWGLSDGLPRSIGVDGTGPTGPGRTGPQQTTRNAQTLWNVAFRGELFSDGRSSSLEEQALLPIEDEHELALDLSEAVARLNAVADYRERFARAFPNESQGIDSSRLARALGAFERTLVSRHAPYDQYVDGDAGALGDREREGMFLFAEAGCASCHIPPLFESNRFARRRETDDPGRLKISGNEQDRGAFRVATLRNLRETGPYFHDGSIATLEQAVAEEADKSREEGGMELTSEQLDLVATFLRKGLMDKSEEPSRPEEVPSGLAVPIDGFRVPR